MLVAHTMGSHGGQQNFPFGYNPNELHGIGLPDFMTPGPPPGPPILDDHDHQRFESFLTDFTDGRTNFSAGIDPSQNWMMPPTLVGSETSLRQRSGTEWQTLPPSDYGFGNDNTLTHIPPTASFSNGVHGHNFMSQGRYDTSSLGHLHMAAQAGPGSYPHSWQQQFLNQHPNDIRPLQKPMMRFGSDSDFQPTGYVPPEGQLPTETVPSFDWLEENSAANTRPNTQPNTQPSSPTVPRKRKLDGHQDDPRRNGFAPTTKGLTASIHRSPYSNSHQQNKYFVKQEQSFVSKPTMTTSIRLPNVPQETEDDADEDADFDEDDDDPESQQRSPSPAFTTRSRPGKNVKRPSSRKDARPRRKSSPTNTPVKHKSKPSRSSTGGTPSTRVPLSADQKKLNHTNSEQRRRDATARAYAELYDLVPELDEVGKQSTMKKLEIVVAKVAKVKTRVTQLRLMLGMDPEGGVNGLSGPSFQKSHSTTSINPYSTDQGEWRT